MDLENQFVACGVMWGCTFESNQMTLSKSSFWTSTCHEALDAAQVVENGRVVKYPHFGGKKYKAEYHIFPYILYKSTFYKVSQRGNGVMDSALTGFVGGLSLILAIALFWVKFQFADDFFSLSGVKVVGEKEPNKIIGVVYHSQNVEDKKILALIYEQTRAKARNVWLILVHYSNYLSYWASSPASFQSNIEVIHQ